MIIFSLMLKLFHHLVMQIVKDLFFFLMIQSERKKTNSALFFMIHVFLFWLLN
jgi:hypothetical protein